MYPSTIKTTESDSILATLCMSELKHTTQLCRTKMLISNIVSHTTWMSIGEWYFQKKITLPNLFIINFTTWGISHTILQFLWWNAADYCSHLRIVWNYSDKIGSKCSCGMYIEGNARTASALPWVCHTLLVRNKLSSQNPYICNMCWFSLFSMQ